MTDDLIKRLRAKETIIHNSFEERRCINPNGHEAADALKEQAKRIEHLEMQLRLSVNSDSEYCKTVEAENAHLRICIAELEAALKKWDALIKHQYTGSREAMSAMTDCAQETAKLLYGDAPFPYPQEPR